MSKKAYALKYVIDHLKTQEMCEKAIEECQCKLEYVQDHLKMQKLCGAVAMEDLLLLRYVPDWFVT